MPFNIFVLLATLSIPQTECATNWHGIFPNADITFMFTPACSKLYDVDPDLLHFQDVRLANYYTPLILYIPCHAPETIHAPNGSINSLEKHRDTDKSARPKAIFLSLDATMGYDYEHNILF